MKKPVIICVDDEPMILDSLKRQLRTTLGRNYLIETSENGEEALETLTELLDEQSEVVLVISDYLMPKIQGDELLKQIHVISPKTIKIMLTGQADLQAVTNAINHAKLYRYITKPWEPEDLILTVKEAVNSYFQDKKLEEQNAKLQQMNRELEVLNKEQAELIAELHDNENRLRQFLEAMPVGVGVLNANGNIYYINQKAKELFGKGIVPDLTVEKLSEAYQTYKAGTDEQYPPEQLPIAKALQGESAQADDVEIHRGEQIIPLEIRATPIYNEGGDIVSAINVLQDITERKQSEAERQQFIEELFEVNCNMELALQAELELAEAARRFVPNEFLSFLGHERLADVKLGDAVEQEMSILFSDIRNFTTLSETMSPEDNFKFINGYLSRMEPAIVENRGFIDKYIGDAIMALFSGSADDAVNAGIRMLHLLTDYNQTRQRPDRQSFQIGIGINTGSLMLGIVGGKNRMDSTVISDAVNLASRLEGLTKIYGVSLLISRQTFWRLQNPSDFSIRLIDHVKVKGKSKIVSVFEVFDADPLEILQGKLATRTVFEQALSLYHIQLFGEAAELFADCLRHNPGDTVARTYLERCRREIGDR